MVRPKMIVNAMPPNASWSSCVRTTPISTPLSLKTVSVPMLPTSRPCTITVATIFSGSKKAIMPISSHRCRPLRKIENETFNTLKNQGYNFEHNYGHGEQNLSVVFATLMMLAFLVDQTQQLCCALFRAVWTKLGSKRRLWERMRALFYDYRLESMRELLEALFYGFEKPRPILITDTS